MSFKKNLYGIFVDFAVQASKDGLMREDITIRQIHVCIDHLLEKAAFYDRVHYEMCSCQKDNIKYKCRDCEKIYSQKPEIVLDWIKEGLDLVCYDCENIRNAKLMTELTTAELIKKYNDKVNHENTMH